MDVVAGTAAMVMGWESHSVSTRVAEAALI